MLKTKQVVKDSILALDELEDQMNSILEEGGADLDTLYEDSVKQFEADTILTGRVISFTNTEVVVDVGYKSEGLIYADEFGPDEELVIGATVEVLLESVEDDTGMLAVSKRKADRIRGWEKIIATHKEGDVVTGKVTRKIKGGLLVEIGVPVFLPASQISIRRTGDISEWIGQDIECKIIKIDEARMNIVVSRRKLIEEEREKLKVSLLQELRAGDIIRGVVKNIADFGAFVDLGGIDGLLHITDMSWSRINHPTELVKIDEEIEVKVLSIDYEKERIALGMKQKSESPWKNIEMRFPIGEKVHGEVVNIRPYGAFVKLEEGIEGLVHVSEMSWTKRINHPSEILSVGDDIEVVVLNIKPEAMEISLGIKQAESNPWDGIEDRYPIGHKINGIVRTLTNYGAFVELEEGIDGLLHVSDISWTKKVSHPNELLKKGEEIEALVLSVDSSKKRVALGVKQMSTDPWEKHIPATYKEGQIVRGRITKITNFGVFVELESDLEGLLHVSELSEDSVKDPNELVNVGDIKDLKVIKVDEQERKIGLSIKAMTDGGVGGGSSSTSTQSAIDKFNEEHGADA